MMQVPVRLLENRTCPGGFVPRPPSSPTHIFALHSNAGKVPGFWPDLYWLLLLASHVLEAAANSTIFCYQAYPHKLATRKDLRHQNQIAAAAAGNLQNAAMFHPARDSYQRSAHDCKVRTRFAYRLILGAHVGRSESPTARRGGTLHHQRGGAAAATLAKPVLRYHPLFAVSCQVRTLSKEAER
jgi:hypothetical protein